MDATPPPTAELLDEHLRQTLGCYDEALLRQVAQKLCRPRNQWPADELVERIRAGLANPVMLDRRLRELPAACRQLLGLIGYSRQPRWSVGSLVEMAVTLGHDDGLAPVVELLGAGLLLPELFPSHVAAEPPPARARVKGFETWLGAAAGRMPHVVAAPLAVRRALAGDLGLPECPVLADAGAGGERAQEADGLEWPLRLATMHQRVLGAPLRRTQQGDFFKRDLERLGDDPILNTPPDAPATLPEPARLAAAMALASGLLHERDNELTAGTFSPAWFGPEANLLAELWSALPLVRGWEPVAGGRSADAPGNPYPGAQLLAMALLTRLPADGWARPEAIEEWIAQRHPFWRDGTAPPPGVATFLLGVMYLLRLTQVCPGPAGSRLVRLSPTGRWVLGLAAEPPPQPAYPQTLLVQPNLEILAYRQGLTPPLIVALGRFATWKSLGAACTLQLEPQSVYRGLESGETFAGIVRTLERHGMKALPSAVLESLRTWSNKRERITVYPAAALFEFASADELTEAIARGLPAQRLTDRLAVVASEAEIEYRQFRLTGTRDYCQPPERCVDVEADGVTLDIDPVRSDLLLEMEVRRFAEPVAGAANGRRRYRLTPESLGAARDQGVTAAFLEHWFSQRTGVRLPPAARLLFSGADVPRPELRRQVVLHVASAEIADGLEQWPATRPLIQARLGPAALAVAEDDVAALTAQLAALGIGLEPHL